MRPQTQFTKSGDITIAYQVSGDGPVDLVFAEGWLTNVEFAWENPAYARFFDRLGSFSRLIRFDKRGMGMSDRDVGYPTLEHRMDDLQAVMDAVGSERAAIFGVSEGGCLATLFAASYPERTTAAILFGCFAKGVGAADYPWQRSVEENEQYVAELDRNWGDPFDLTDAAPSVAQAEWARNWFAAYLRYSASPRSALDYTRTMSGVDVRTILPTIRVPTLVLQRRGDRWALEGNGRYLAAHIPNATYIALPGEDHFVWAGDQDQIVDEVREFVTGARGQAAPERTLLTVLMTDLVGSTAMVAKLGDQQWRHLLDRHNDLVRRQLSRHRGQEVKTTGDGFLVTFEGPTPAIQCASAINREIESLGLRVRAAIHTGECERHGQDLSGIAVHIASRILDRAQPGTTWVSSTVKDLVVGSGIEFAAQGAANLKGVPDSWTLFSVVSPES